MNFLFLGNLGQGEIIIIAVIGIIVLILPVLLILLICGAFTSFPPRPANFGYFEVETYCNTN